MFFRATDGLQIEPVEEKKDRGDPIVSWLLAGSEMTNAPMRAHPTTRHSFFSATPSHSCFSSSFAVSVPIASKYSEDRPRVIAHTTQHNKLGMGVMCWPIGEHIEPPN